MSEERKTKADAAAPASAALGRIDRKDAFLQALHTFLTAHQGTEWAVAAVDIQHFKLYNELYGTEKGDALLETVANCLLGYSRQTGYPVGYFGNDDFFLCLPDEKAEQTAVLATLQACMAAGRQDVTFFMVMGVCPVQANPGADAATLCNYAQIAGVTTDSGYLHRFEPTMLNELKEQQQLLGELERALDNHEFCFFLQPKCNSITRAIVGMEALVRWNHPTRGCVPPAEFMPLLERTGLVTRLDQYIWESVCQTLQKLGKDKTMHVIANDFLEENLKWLKEGTINFLIGQDAAVQGHSPVIILFQLLFDSKAPEKEYQYTDIVIRTKYNMG